MVFYNLFSGFGGFVLDMTGITLALSPEHSIGSGIPAAPAFDSRPLNNAIYNTFAHNKNKKTTPTLQPINEYGCPAGAINIQLNNSAAYSHTISSTEDMKMAEHIRSERAKASDSYRYHLWCKWQHLLMFDDVDDETKDEIRLLYCEPPAPEPPAQYNLLELPASFSCQHFKALPNERKTQLSNTEETMSDTKREFHVQGDYIETQNIYVSGDMYQCVGATEKSHIQEAKPQDASPQLLSELAPMFKNKPDEAARFLADIEGATPSGITQTVNDYLDQKKIADWAKKSELYQVLHRHGIYKLTLGNWNKRVK